MGHKFFVVLGGGTSGVTLLGVAVLGRVVPLATPLGGAAILGAA